MSPEQETMAAFGTEAGICGRLISRLNHPVEIAYNGEAMMLPPRGQCKELRKDLIGAIPKGVVFVPYV